MRGHARIRDKGACFLRDQTHCTGTKQQFQPLWRCVCGGDATPALLHRADRPSPRHPALRAEAPGPAGDARSRGGGGEPAPLELSPLPAHQLYLHAENAGLPPRSAHTCPPALATAEPGDCHRDQGACKAKHISCRGLHGVRGPDPTRTGPLSTEPGRAERGHGPRGKRLQVRAVALLLGAPAAEDTSLQTRASLRAPDSPNRPRDSQERQTEKGTQFPVCQLTPPSGRTGQ